MVKVNDDGKTMTVKCENGTSHERKHARILIPSQEQYNDTLKRLTEEQHMKALMAVRLGCECGMSRIEVSNAEVANIDREHKRGLWIQIAKHIKSKKKKEGKPIFEMRSREVPIPVSLYGLLTTYMDSNQKYILIREKGDITKPFQPLHINFLYEEAKVPWSSHKSRHYFKNRMMDWMRANRQVDVGLLKELMGHAKDVHESYGSISWDYKRDTIDKVFK